MRTTWIAVSFILHIPLLALPQPLSPSVKEMRWRQDFNLYVKLSNDSSYVVDVRGLYHTGEGIVFDTVSPNTTYYPVTLDPEFVRYIKQGELSHDPILPADSLAHRPPVTLWSALNGRLGGGYVHFLNCLLYALESQHLNLSDPLMLRPVTQWKPKPMTQSFKRTRNWSHYIPMDQGEAKREYRLRRREGALQDLTGVPTRFIELFLSTSEQQYEELRIKGRRHQRAQIDLIKLLLGAKYLGKDQIAFIQSRVIESVVTYRVSNLPSIIIFDDFNAAVAMALDVNGYKIDYIVFQYQEELTEKEYSDRLNRIESLINAINHANNKVFMKRLQNYYE